MSCISLFPAAGQGTETSERSKTSPACEERRRSAGSESAAAADDAAGIYRKDVVSLSCTFFLWRRTLATVCGDCRDFAEQESERTRSEAENQWGGSVRMERKDVWRERDFPVVRVTR